jgi:peptidoglycan/LPS O-acetylase OafA/YrhL
MSTSYIKKLDYLRAISIFIVLLSHWIHDCKVEELAILDNRGVYGVNLFFVISGFLITRNLLFSIKKHSFGKTLKNFFIKRFLRLIPVYYLLLLTLFLLQYFLDFWVVNDYKDYLWFVFYIPNFYIYFYGWNYPSINQAWSLGVEEQFYLIWPFIVYYFRKHLMLVFVILILSGFVFTFYFYPKAHLIPIGNFVYLAGGALLSLIEQKIDLKKSLLIALFSVLLLLFTDFGNIISSIFWACFYISLINAFCYKFSDGFEKFFSNSKILYIGKISYGIYLYHRFLPHFTNAILLKYNINIDNRIVFISLFFIVFVIAHLSYKYYESYFLNIKRRID